MKRLNRAIAVCAFLLVLVGRAPAAGPFTVNVTNDTHAVTPASSALDATGHISLRSAIEAANAQSGATTINLPIGIYTLTLGELLVAPSGGKTLIVQTSGGNASNTIISQTDGTNRVFNIDIASAGSTSVTISGVTIRGGRDQADILGGAGILAGSVSSTPKDVLTISNCVIANNRCSPPNTNYTSQPGGGIQMAGGDLIIFNCTFSNNISAASMGGGIAMIAQSVASSLTITGSTFSNNSMTNTSGSGPDGGGAIYINTTAGSTHYIGSSTFSSNLVAGNFGTTYGGAIHLNTGTLNVTNSTFTANSATGQGGQGGAIFVDSGNANISYCRIVGNIAPSGGAGVYNHGTNGATTIAQNNWWGCNGGPSALGCDAASSNGGTLTVNPFIVLTNTASPAGILPNQSTTLTASFLRNSTGAVLNVSQISVLIGLPVTWGNAVLGTLSAQQTSIQANGTATATYTAGNAGGAGHADAMVENGVATAQITVICPSITAVVSGGGSICPGGTASVSVSVTGGTSPYTITLDNGGGTQSGPGPFTFSVSPAATTTYSISSGQDAHSCPVTPSGNALVTVGALATPSITASPASVYANSGANQAAGPPAMTTYSWTISNGVIIGPANLQSISYVAGVSGNVALGLTVSNGSGCSASNLLSVPITTGFSVHSNLTFIDALAANTMGMAFDGTNYWSCSGGSSAGVRLARYTSAGISNGLYAAGLDFRSIFTRADGTVLARAFNSRIIYQQISPGVFSNSVTLTGGTLDAQSSVVLNSDNTEFIAMSGGTVSRWNTNGTNLASVTLQGFASLTGEDMQPQSRGIAAYGGLWLTYSGAGIVSLWDYSGNRLAQIPLPGAGTSFDSDYSFSFCNAKVFIVDVAGGRWRAFDLFNGAAVAAIGAEGDATWNADVTNKIFAAGAVRRVDFIRVVSGDPLPTLGQLRSYQSVLVYSDSPFNDSIAMGNVLADYIDQGGGVALATFAFYNGAGLGIQGRLVSGGYLPFTTGSATSGTTQTLVADLPSHPLLDGVASFNGGTSSFRNSPIAITAGSTLVAHWSDGQPLVGARDMAPGRIAGLNFFPPSNNGRSDFWLATTDGGRLMSDALLWSGRIPPMILSAPTDRIVPVGSAVSFSVVASGASPLSYQWRLNGTNIPAATNSILTFTVQTNSMGFYSVAVSNLYGMTYSVNASLNPQLRFVTPGVSVGGNFPVLLQNVDGSFVDSNRAARVQISATTNLLGAPAPWTPLTNAVTSSNGLLRVDGLNTTNSVRRYFRATETP